MQSSEKLTVGIIIGSTRPGRIAPIIGKWAAEQAEAFGGFNVQVLDLAEENLPFMDEPNHPRLKQYQYDHTKRWSAKVDACDAFVIVSPEYNHGMSAPLKNAIDFLHQEWILKPVAYVSYGGLSAGGRAMQMNKQVFAAFKMLQLTEGVMIPMPQQFIKDGVFVGNDMQNSSAQQMYAELLRTGTALKAVRNK
jgi:NAD(P)H-dependent FMN reductase